MALGILLFLILTLVAVCIIVFMELDPVGMF